MIPVNEPLLGENTLKYVADCVESGWISSAGAYIRKFEKAFAEYLGVRHAVTVTSGTTALHLALAALDIGPDDEVLIPALTMIAVPYAVLYTGATPIPLDVDPEIYNLDPERVREFMEDRCRYDKSRKLWVDRATGKAVRAVIPVHLYGHPCPMEDLMDLARSYGLAVVEDAAEAHGALYRFSGDPTRTRAAGAIGDIGCFSFYANKIITTGEGGMVVTGDDGLAEKARRLKDLAHAPGARFLHTDLAFNYRMTNLQAAVGLAQLERIEANIAVKRDMAAAYEKLLSGIPGLTLPREKEWARNVYWMYAVCVEESFGLPRDALMRRLRDKGVDTRSFFVPVNRQPALERIAAGGVFPESPVADDLAARGFYLPSGLAITGDQIETVCRALGEIRAESG